MPKAISEVPAHERHGDDPGRQNTWVNRIVGRGEEAPDQLLANPYNFRTHPGYQQEIVKGSLEKLGVIRDVLVNRRTGHVLDGHLRVKLALRRGEATVPVTYVDLDPDEEKLAIAMLDPTSALAGTDAELERDVLKEISAMVGDSEALSEFVESRLTDLNEDLRKVGIEDEDEEDGDGEGGGSGGGTGVFGLVEGVIFPSKNPMGFPELRSDRLHDFIPSKIWDGVSDVGADPEEHLYIYGTSKPPDNGAGGVLAFYTDDYRFEVVWNECVRITEKFLGYGWGGIVMPDFSMFAEHPLAVQAWAFYRSCYVARYWQEAGIPVIPNINFAGEETYDWPSWVIPKGAPVVATQVRSSHKHSEILKRWELRGLQATISKVEPQHVLIYGGLDHRGWVEPELPDGPTYHFLDSWTNQRRKQKVFKRNRNKDVAIMGDEP
ncbi:MAG TPA: DUF4417 domain-containing protein [Gemmatimonadaceae bacterium]|nr:DUF4417 domain-containing protein [Gemmatimonadaceae bacterium]